METLIHIENPTRYHSVSRFYFIFIWSSTCFGRHAAHHQEPKTALAASGFAYVEGCWTVVAGHWQCPATTHPATFYICKTRGCQCSFRLLMMGGVSPETCWASYKYEIKFCTLWYLVGFSIRIILWCMDPQKIKFMETLRSFAVLGTTYPDTVSHPRTHERSATLMRKLKMLLIWSYWLSLPATWLKLKPQCLFTASHNFVCICCMSENSSSASYYCKKHVNHFNTLTQ